MSHSKRPVVVALKPSEIPLLTHEEIAKEGGRGWKDCPTRTVKRG